MSLTHTTKYIVNNTTEYKNRILLLLTTCAIYHYLEPGKIQGDELF